MAMFIKMLLALVITVCLAAAAVYYGSTNFELLNGVPQKTTHTKTQEVPTQRAKRFLDKYIKKKPVTLPPVQTEPLPQSQIIQEDVHTQKQIEIYPDKSSVIEQLMMQAELIKSDSLRDQAHLDIVNYAAKFGIFAAANTAMKNIKQIELRDTARGNIAISMARAGMADEAFDVIDNVEIETLRDVMRLQVIEAIAMPDRMPPRIQR